MHTDSSNRYFTRFSKNEELQSSWGILTMNREQNPEKGSLCLSEDFTEHHGFSFSRNITFSQEM